MKKTVSYLLLSAYVLIMLKPLLPYAADMAAHLFWKWEHIATVHHENGSSHLHYDLQRAAEDYPDDSTTPLSKVKTEVAPHLMPEPMLAYEAGVCQIISYCSYIHLYSHIYLNGDYPPPKA